jgi:hypothetical protein
MSHNKSACPLPLSPRSGERGSILRNEHPVTACPYGTAVCTEPERRQWGECLECWAGTRERANAVAEWLRQE